MSMTDKNIYQENQNLKEYKEHKDYQENQKSISNLSFQSLNFSAQISSDVYIIQKLLYAKSWGFWIPHIVTIPLYSPELYVSQPENGDQHTRIIAPFHGRVNFFLSNLKYCVRCREIIEDSDRSIGLCTKCKNTIYEFSKKRIFSKIQDQDYINETNFRCNSTNPLCNSKNFGIKCQSNYIIAFCIVGYDNNMNTLIIAVILTKKGEIQHILHKLGAIFYVILGSENRNLNILQSIQFLYSFFRPEIGNVKYNVEDKKEEKILNSSQNILMFNIIYQLFFLGNPVYLQMPFDFNNSLRSSFSKTQSEDKPNLNINENAGNLPYSFINELETEVFGNFLFRSMISLLKILKSDMKSSVKRQDEPNLNLSLKDSFLNNSSLNISSPIGSSTNNFFSNKSQPDMYSPKIIFLGEFLNKIKKRLDFINNFQYNDEINFDYAYHQSGSGMGEFTYFESIMKESIFKNLESKSTQNFPEGFRQDSSQTTYFMLRSSKKIEILKVGNLLETYIIPKELLQFLITMPESLINMFFQNSKSPIISLFSSIDAFSPSSSLEMKNEDEFDSIQGEVVGGIGPFIFLIKEMNDQLVLEDEWIYEDNSDIGLDKKTNKMDNGGLKENSISSTPIFSILYEKSLIGRILL